MEQIKGYRLLEALHHGSKTVIYRALRESDGQAVVLKLLANPFPRPLEIARLRREFELFQGRPLEGVPVLEALEKQGNLHFIVMQDAGGVPVRTFLGNQRPDIGVFLNFAVQVCQVLTRIHARQIIHKDIKPGNLLVLPDSGQVQVIDFSLSVRATGGSQEATATGALEGTLAYLSPEQTGRMNRPVDYRSDLYALGVTLFELLTGRLPFSANHPLEWVHAHLAQEPPDPRTLRPDVPDVLAAMLLKLLAKMAEERYPSAFSLQQDLERCQAQWRERQRIEPFPLATAGAQGLFLLPAQLYGRDAELHALSATVERIVRAGQPELVLVSGYSGIGKTMLVQEARQQIAVAKGYFVSGKFDQLNRGIPYQGFSLAFGELAKQLLTEKEGTLQRLKAQLLEVLGDNAQIINELVPAFEWVLGTHPSPPQLLPEEASNRFLRTWREFVRVLAAPEHPLVVFLDDLQWADVASLRLLELLLADPDIRAFGLVGSYRSNEVDAAHPLAQTIAKAREAIPVHELDLMPLRLADVQAFLADAFSRSTADTAGLAQLLLSKTEGNPFFLTQALKSLHEAGAIHFDAQRGLWDWDLRRIAGMHITDNVVELLVGNIRKLPPAAQQVLCLAACIGNEFSLRALSWVVAPEDLPALAEAIEQGLVSPLDENYVLLADAEQLNAYYYGKTAEAQPAEDAQFRFLHDRVQQAAYSMLSEAARRQVHLKLGRNLLEHTPAAERDDHIFEICNHLNQARELLPDAAQRAQLAELNWAAGTKARTATAYGPALDYLNIGMALLPTAAWETTYALWFGLHLEAAQCQYLNGDLAAAEQTLADLLAHSSTRLDKLLVYRVMVDMYTARVLYHRVTDTVRAALKLFSIAMPTRPVETKARIMAGIAEIKYRMRSLSPDDLVNLPRCTDADHIKLAEILLEAGPSAYQSNQDLFAWMVLFEVRYALRLGNTPSSALGYTGYGMIMNAAFGDVNAAYAFAKMGQRLNEQFGNPFPLHKLKFVELHFVTHFKESIVQDLEQFPHLYRLALASGDLVYAAYYQYDLICYKGALGYPLAEVCAEGMTYLQQMAQLKNTNGYDLLLSRFQTYLALQDRPLLPWVLGQAEATVEERAARYVSERSFSQLANLYLTLCQTGYLLDNNPDLARHILEGARYEEYLSGTYVFADYALYTTLAAYKVLGKQKGDAAARLKKLIKRQVKTLKKRAAHCPENYACAYLIAAAVRELLGRRPVKGLPLLEQAIDQGEQRDLHQMTAVAKELLAQYYLAQNQRKIARLYLRESLYAYERWGAVAKVQHLTETYPNLLLSPVAETDAPVTQQDSESSSGKHGLDLATLMKSATAISGEILLDKLLPAMIHIVVENAGAQRGFLVLEKNGTSVLAAAYDTAQPEAVLLPDIPVADSGMVPETVLAYSHRTREPVVLDLATTDARFRLDPYIAAHQPKSVLCIPIVHQSACRGALYLENNLIAQAFPEERVQVMNILSAQIAVSLDNALLYHNLEEALHQQVTLTEAYSRFTPKAYLRFLGLTSILDVKLGDHRSETMTVLFSDIRAYTSIAEQLSSEENFLFLSAYLEQMSGVVARHNGMVNQLLGDGILAFFAHPNDALRAAVEMQERLRNYVVRRPGKTDIPVKIGIGLHTGEVIIGIVGNEQSMDTGIVSDTVNAASRIEGLTKYYGVNILLSETVVEHLDADARTGLRALGRVQVKGKREDIGLYECIAGDPADLRQRKAELLAEYHRALEHYFDRRFVEAIALLEALAQQHADDPVLHLYLHKARHWAQTGAPDDWNGVDAMEMK